MAPLTSFSPSESVSDAISQQIGRLIESYRGRSGRIVAEIIAEGQTDPEVLADFREHYLLRRRAAARELVEHGKATGELDPHFDSDLMCDLIYGSIYYRLLVGHLPLDDAFAQMLPQQMLSALQRGAADTASQPDFPPPS
jgi:Tetracyclin repressor-like, C-terminal domain